MSAELVSLLRGCMLEPDSPGPRRVVGDWLEENGEGESEAALAGLLRARRRRPSACRAGGRR